MESRNQQSPFKSFIKQGPVESFIAGGVAAGISRTCVSPIERVKIIFQIQGPGSPNYKGVIPTVKQIWAEEGIKGMFRGNGINCMRIIPHQALQFSTFNYVKKNFFLQNSKEEKLTNIQRLIAGGCGGFMGILFTYPIDVTRTRLSVQTAQNLANLKKGKIDLTQQKPPGFRKILGSIYKNEGGIRGVYRGFVVSACGNVPYIGINFMIYEQLEELWPEDRCESSLVRLINGCIAGGVSQGTIHPMDLLRRRFQVMSMANSELGFHYNSFGDAVTTIFREEGIKGFYKGMLPNLVRVVPAMGISWLSFQTVKDFIDNL